MPTAEKAKALFPDSVKPPIDADPVDPTKPRPKGQAMEGKPTPGQESTPEEKPTIRQRIGSALEEFGGQEEPMTPETVTGLPKIPQSAFEPDYGRGSMGPTGVADQLFKEGTPGAVDGPGNVESGATEQEDRFLTMMEEWMNEEPPMPSEDVDFSGAMAPKIPKWRQLLGEGLQAVGSAPSYFGPYQVPGVEGPTIWDQYRKQNAEVRLKEAERKSLKSYQYDTQKFEARQSKMRSVFDLLKDERNYRRERGDALDDQARVLGLANPEHYTDEYKSGWVADKMAELSEAKESREERKVDLQALEKWDNYIKLGINPLPEGHELYDAAERSANHYREVSELQMKNYDSLKAMREATTKRMEAQLKLLGKMNMYQLRKMEVGLSEKVFALRNYYLTEYERLKPALFGIGGGSEIEKLKLAELGRMIAQMEMGAAEVSAELDGRMRQQVDAGQRPDGWNWTPAWVEATVPEEAVTIVIQDPGYWMLTESEKSLFWDRLKQDEDQMVPPPPPSFPPPETLPPDTGASQSGGTVF